MSTAILRRQRQDLSEASIGDRMGSTSTRTLILACLALAAAGLLLVWTAFSASIPGSPWRFSLAYAVVEIVLQLLTIRRLDTRGVVAAIFLVLLYPYLYFAIPSRSGALGWREDLAKSA